MKLLYCEQCLDTVRPVPGHLGEPRFCLCKRHAIWSLDKQHGEVRVFDLFGHDGIPDVPAAYVLLISNQLLEMPGKMAAADVGRLIEQHGDENAVKQMGSLIVRVRPGEHPRTAWADLPLGITRWTTAASD